MSRALGPRQRELLARLDRFAGVIVYEPHWRAPMNRLRARGVLLSLYVNQSGVLLILNLSDNRVPESRNA